MPVLWFEPEQANSEDPIPSQKFTFGLLALRSAIIAGLENIFCIDPCFDASGFLRGFGSATSPLCVRNTRTMARCLGRSAPKLEGKRENTGK